MMSGKGEAKTEKNIRSKNMTNSVNGAFRCLSCRSSPKRTKADRTHRRDFYIPAPQIAIFEGACSYEQRALASPWLGVVSHWRGQWVGSNGSPLDYGFLPKPSMLAGGHGFGSAFRGHSGQRVLQIQLRSSRCA